MPILCQSILDTPLGELAIVGDDAAIYLTGFTDGDRLDAGLNRLKRYISAEIVPGMTHPLDSISREIAAYFSGSLHEFRTPIRPLGSVFQQNVWTAIQAVVFGRVSTYASQAAVLKIPSGYRAVANAIAANPLVIVVPCHRIIGYDGRLGGYSGGTTRKQWLIDHEKKYGSR